MADDKLAGHLDVVSPSLPDLLELLAKHVPKTGTLALRFDEHPEAFDGLTALEAGSAFLPDGTPDADYQRKLAAFFDHAMFKGFGGPNTAGGQPPTFDDSARVMSCGPLVLPSLDYVRSGLVIAVDGTSIDLGDGAVTLRGCHVATVRDRTMFIESDPPPRARRPLGSGGNAHDRRVRRRQQERNKATVNRALAAAAGEVAGG